MIPGSDPRNILKDVDKIKNPWDYKNVLKENQVKSRTELIEKRRKDKIPDPSYDLDGDGFVGGRDYVISKRFDVNKRGKLNDEERKVALEAIKKNVEDEYVWNLENQGVGRPCRILQKRGKIIDNENFVPLSDTYPRHPLSDIIPDHTTFTNLKESRRDEVKKYVKEKQDLWELHNPTQVKIDPNIKRDNKDKPKFSSIKQIKENNNKIAREKIGLSEKSDIKVTDKDPGLNYVYDPECKTKSDIKERMKKENFELSKKILSRKHMTDVERLNYREDEIFDMAYYHGERKTLNKLKEERKKEMCEYNMKVFSNQTIGVHGHELPKFSESEFKEFWKYNEGWVENPEYQSRVEMLENKKYWKKNEDLLIKDFKEEIPDPDEFKKTHIPIEKNSDLIIKVNNLNHFKNFDPDNPQPIDIENVKRNHIYKWTTLVNQFSKQNFKNGRYFDNLPVDNTEKNNNVKENAENKHKE